MIKKFVELHCHLDGAITVPIARKLAGIQNLEVPGDDQLKRLLTVPEDCASLDDMLKCFAFPLTLLQTKEGIANAVRLILEEQKKQGVIYAELRFCPPLHTDRGLSAEEAVLAALEGLKQSPIKANLILCAMRGIPDADNQTVLKLVKKYLVPDGGVVAFDIAGSEQYSFASYRWMLQEANELCLPFTVHVGEAAGSGNVRLAIEMGAKRIGHGVRSAEDPQVVELVRNSGVTLEMCPTSNRMTKAVADMTKYPLNDFLSRGIKVTVNTDDPAIEGATLPEEFAYIEDMYGITEAQQKQLTINAIHAAFTTDEVKLELLKQL